MQGSSEGQILVWRTDSWVAEENFGENVEKKQFTNADFLSDVTTIGNGGAWQTIAIIPGISALSSVIEERVSYANFLLYDYSDGNGEARQIIDFTISRFAQYAQITLNHNDITYYPSNSATKIKKNKSQTWKSFYWWRLSVLRKCSGFS